MFPLQVGKQVGFETYGNSGSGRWHREHRWEVVGQYPMSLGSQTDQIYAISIQVEARNFYKFEGTCDYSARLAICIKRAGTTVSRRNPQLNGPASSNMIRAILDGVDTPLPKP